VLAASHSTLVSISSTAVAVQCQDAPQGCFQAALHNTMHVPTSIQISNVTGDCNAVLCNMPRTCLLRVCAEAVFLLAACWMLLQAPASTCLIRLVRCSRSSTPL
jgi:hypothetical protein